jgi:hypothetical protein
METDWTENLTPAEAQAALNALNTNKVPITAREAVEPSEAETGARGQGRRMVE